MVVHSGHKQPAGRCAGANTAVQWGPPEPKGGPFLLFRRLRCKVEGEMDEQKGSEAGVEPVPRQAALPKDNPVRRGALPAERSFPERSASTYFLLVYALTVPVWVLSSLLGNKLPIPVNLPISVLAFANPLIAAAILAYRREGASGVRQLLARAFDWRRTRSRIWYVPALLLIPAVYLASYVITRLAGLPLPDPIEVPWLWTPGLFLAFFAGATFEELGWSGYALDPLQRRWGALAAAVTIGLVWQAWHVIGQLQAENAPAWILWHSLYSVSLRVLMVWVYNNTGKSVFAASLMHAADNVSWVLFPNLGSHLLPFIPFVLATGLAAAVAVLWGPRTLARCRPARA